MAFVQAPNPTSTAGSVNTSISLAFGSNNTAGNCLLACITWSSFSGAVLTGVTDTRGNTWVQVGERQVDLHNINTFCALFAAFNCAAGSNTVTANYSTSGSDYLQLAIREYSGAAVECGK